MDETGSARDPAVAATTTSWALTSAAKFGWKLRRTAVSTYLAAVFFTNIFSGYRQRCFGCVVVLSVYVLDTVSAFCEVLIPDTYGFGHFVIFEVIFYTHKNFVGNFKKPQTPDPDSGEEKIPY